MSRLSRRSARPRTRQSGELPCPCGSDGTYAQCCGRLHAGQDTAGTAEALMRSRYSAFAVGDADYLLRTWHPDTRPAELDLTADRQWTRLEVLGTTGGTAFHSVGEVSFRAHYRDADGPGVQTETSSFARYNGTWVYTGPASPV